jgi:hypothetical protein
MASTHRAGLPADAREPGGSPPSGVEEHVLHSERLQIERKTFTLSMRENPRGRFLRITEDVAGRHDTIIVPAPGLKDFLRVLTEMAQKAEPEPTKGEEATSEETVPA